MASLFDQFAALDPKRERDQIDAYAGGAGGNYLPLAGGTLTGALTMSPPAGTASIIMSPQGATSSSIFYLIKNGSGTFSQIIARNGAANRWIMSLGDTTAEGGSNAGSNFVIARYTDAGGTLGSPLTINRATGNVALTGSIGVNGTAAPAKPTVTGAKGSNTALASLLAALVAYGLITDSTTA